MTITTTNHTGATIERLDPAALAEATSQLDSTGTRAESAAESPPGIRVAGLTQDGSRALCDVTFEVDPGEVFVIAGAADSSKSTLLAAIAGVQPAAAGEVLVDGAPFDPHSTDVPFGYVPQDAGDPVQLGTASDPLANPKVLFLDEPTAELAPAVATGVMRHLRRRAESGTTIVLTAHSSTDVEHADRLALLTEGGHLAFVGTPDEARARFGVDDLGRLYDDVAHTLSIAA